MSIAVLGENIVDFIQQSDGQFAAHLGGSPFNVAIGLARQGVEVCYLSPLSTDQFGDQFEHTLLSEGVKLVSDGRSDKPSSLALVTLDSNGQASYRLYREGVADKDISCEQICLQIPASTRIFHTGSLAITPDQLNKVVQVIERLKSQGVLISIDINIRTGVWADSQAYLQGVRSLLPLADIVKASDDDLAAFAAQVNPESIAQQFYQEMNSGVLLFTKGAKGATLLCSLGRCEAAAIQPQKVVDTIGAGDTFHAAFLSRVAKQLSSRERLFHKLDDYQTSLNYAVASAAINVGRNGCSPPAENEVFEFLSEQDFGR